MRAVPVLPTTDHHNDSDFDLTLHPIHAPLLRTTIDRVFTKRTSVAPWKKGNSWHETWVDNNYPPDLRKPFDYAAGYRPCTDEDEGDRGLPHLLIITRVRHWPIVRCRVVINMVDNLYELQEEGVYDQYHHILMYESWKRMLEREYENRGWK